MSQDNEMVTVRLIISVVGYGKNTEIVNRPYQMPSVLMDPEAFAHHCPEKHICHKGKSYRFLDCIMEKFLENRRLETVFHVRYILDVEKEKFKSFLRDARPSECPANKSA